ncbi:MULTISPECIES: MlaD family protein [unclassified Arenibacter]|uniref:MlaD family protein n=1 Tax=unclassified Arenibacter TaxID=2615047 RepID=UPI000E342911|nr:MULTISPECIES: MlaD family protein [unclassified Arenibacter]MCM4165512.1 MCE family protein [Arenibacter sp. A80]RFT54977.1 MCE family protein [Arenibacter sp. P308M17]
MAKTKLENLKLGIFVVLGTALLVVATYLIGNRQNMFGKTIPISAIFKNANGLQNGNNVRFSGIKVGTVNKIEMINDTTIRVHMIIEEKVKNHIKKDAVATIGSDGLVGSMLINIVPGEGKSAHIELGDELQSFSRVATQDMLNTLNQTNENAALLTQDLLKVTRSLTQGKGTFGRLLNDSLMAKDLHQTIANLKHTSSEANKMIVQINQIVKQLDFENSATGVLLKDSISGNKMRNVISHLENSSLEIEKMSMNLNAVIGDIKTGKGAINYLATDTVLVRQLETSMENVTEGVKNFNEVTEALKHNFLTRRYFKKKEKEKKMELEKIDEQTP